MKKYFKFLFVFFMLFLLKVNVYAEDVNVMECEYTEQYKRWLLLSDDEKNDAFEPVKCKSDVKFFNNVGESITSFTSSRFDLREHNYVPRVKDQGASNSCWTFSTLDSVESNMLVNNMGTHDFSEAHIELSTQNSLFNGFLPFDRSFDAGGNFLISGAYFTSRVGPVLESDVPFSIITNTLSGNGTATLADISGKNVPYVVNDAAIVINNQGVCSNDTINDVKKYLVNEGAIASSVYFKMLTSNGTLDNGNINDIFTNGQYYYYDGSSYSTGDSGDETVISENQISNHTVTIVGWDDSIPATSFSKTPSRNGAWLVKNSYGEQLQVSGVNINIGNQGYYYISYDDINICTIMGGFHNITNVKEDNTYINDKLGVNDGLLSNRDEVYMANVFDKKSESSEILKKVNFYSGYQGIRYEVLFADSDNLRSITKIAEGTTEHAGYTTVTVPNTSITNSKFTIAVKFYDMNGKVFELYSETPEFGSSYYASDGNEWFDLDTENNTYYVPVRAYTNNAGYTFSVNSVLLNQGDNILNVGFNADNVTNYDLIDSKVYSASDTSFANALNDKFTIDRSGLSSGKTISIALNDNSAVGKYVLVTNYKDATTTVNFEVVEEEGELVLKLIEDDHIEEIVSDDEVIVSENPKNQTVNNIVSTKTGDSLVNPKTGSLHFVVIIVAVVISFLIVMLLNKILFSK